VTWGARQASRRVQLGHPGWPRTLGLRFLPREAAGASYRKAPCHVPARVCPVAADRSQEGPGHDNAESGRPETAFAIFPALG
jgi:hypothetical protein